MKRYGCIVVNSLDGEERTIFVKALSINHARYIIDNSSMLTMFEYIVNIY